MYYTPNIPYNYDMAKPMDVGPQTVSCKIRLLSRLTVACAGRLLKEFDISPVQASVLYELAVGETSPSRIAAHVGVDASILSRQIRLMEASELIERHVDERNRTRVLLKLTKTGRRVAREIDPIAEQVQSILTAALTKDEWKTFERCVEKLNAALQEYSGPGQE